LFFEEIPVVLLDESPSRLDFAVEDVADSFSRMGQLSNLIVRKNPENKGRYQVIAGNRRLNAAKKLGWKTIIARVVDANEVEALIIALSENIDRKDLKDYEQALLIERIHKATGKTYDEIGSLIGRSKAFVSQHIAMLHLFPESVASEEERTRVLSRITERHARVLVKVSDNMERWSMAKLVVTANLGVRELERHYARFGTPQKTEKSTVDVGEVRAVIDCFETGIRTKNLGQILDSISSRNFSMFPHLPPFCKLDSSKAQDHFCEFLSKSDRVQYHIKDLNVRIRGALAYATLLIEYSVRVVGKVAGTKTRVTLIFEKENESWKIVHGHWSSAHPEELLEMLDLMYSPIKTQILKH
jgi:ParB/RepB/Spo0J family partition protein